MQWNRSSIYPVDALTFLHPKKLVKIVIVRFSQLSLREIMMHVGAKMPGRKARERKCWHHLNVKKCQKRTRS